MSVVEARYNSIDMPRAYLAHLI